MSRFPQKEQIHDCQTTVFFSRRILCYKIPLCGGHSDVLIDCHKWNVVFPHYRVSFLLDRV